MSKSKLEKNRRRLVGRDASAILPANEQSMRRNSLDVCSGIDREMSVAAWSVRKLVEGVKPD